MATTMYFEGILNDKESKGEAIALEFGRSSFHGGENLIYINVDGKSVILEEKAGRELCEKMSALARYLGYAD